MFKNDLVQFETTSLSEFEQLDKIFVQGVHL